MNIEDIMPVDVQRLFNAMDGAKETKIKVKNVLNMVFEHALDEELIEKNPLASRSIRITGHASTPTEPYTVAQMRFLVKNLDRVQNPADRVYLALHALHPLRLEEVLGLQWKDIDLDASLIHVNRAATHPPRNQPVIKETKTEASHRTIDLVPQIAPLLLKGAPDSFVLGGEAPLSYTQTRKMCLRIQRDTGFDEAISPRRFRTTVLTDLYDTTKDIKQAQAAAGHTTAAMVETVYARARHSGVMKNKKTLIA